MKSIDKNNKRRSSMGGGWAWFARHFEVRTSRPKEAKDETEKDKELFDFTEQASRSFFEQC
jgi:hypothetical protein